MARIRLHVKVCVCVSRVSEVGSSKRWETVSRGVKGVKRVSRGRGVVLFATVSAPKKHLEAHRAEEERHSCLDVSVEPHHGVSLSVKAV